MRQLIPMLILTGCWVTGPEIQDRLDALPPDTDSTTPPTTTATGSTTTTTTSTTTTTGPTTEPTTDFACADDDIGSSVGPKAASGDTTASGDDHTTDCLQAQDNEDLSFRWTAPNSGCFSFDTFSSDFDTAVYVQESCGGATLACNDDVTPTDLSSQTGFWADGGTSYLVVVDGIANQSGTFDLGIDTAAQIQADRVLSPGAGTFTGDTFGQDDTVTPQICYWPSGADGIYEWSATESGLWTFTLSETETTFDTVLTLHRLCTPDAFVCDDDYSLLYPNGGESVSAWLELNETLLIRIAGYASSGIPAEGAWVLDITR